MRRWQKITLGVITGLIVLLLLNAVVVSNATKDAYVRDTGARLIETSNGTLQVLEQGNPRGTPIVLVHCYTCSISWWDDLAPLLERDHRVIRLDLLGHGGSDKPSVGYSIEDQATAVAEALAKLGVLNATAVGHSLGGSVATALAQQSPQLASRVVIIDQAPQDGFDNEGFAQRVSYWPILGQAGDRLLHIAPKSAIRGQYDDAFAPGYDISSGFDNPDQPVDDLRAMTYTAYKETHDAEQDFVDEAPLDERLATAHVPTMVDLRGRGSALRRAGGRRPLPPERARRADAPDSRRGPLPERRAAEPGGAADPVLGRAAAGGPPSGEKAGTEEHRQEEVRRGPEIAEGPDFSGPSWEQRFPSVPLRTTLRPVKRKSSPCEQTFRSVRGFGAQAGWGAGASVSSSVSAGAFWPRERAMKGRAKAAIPAETR